MSRAGSGAAAAALLAEHRLVREPTTFRLLGAEWDLLPGVYAPALTRSAALYAEWLPYPVGGTFCEIGCGTGYLAVTAAQRGCTGVVALDVNPAAAENARRNARRHGVADRVRVGCGDLFAPLDHDERFDVLFWNSNFVDAALDSTDDGDPVTAAFVDAGYRTHRRFLAGARAHLAPGGDLLLGFCDLGNRPLLDELAASEGLRVRRVRSCTSQTPDGDPLRFDLLRLEAGR